MSYSKINNITGWVICLIASIVYLTTMEPTVSFWDCGEFIASAFNLEIGHPPGAPLHMVMGRVLSLFFPGDKTAMAVNSLSALGSAFTILFLFWSITYLLKKQVIKKFSEVSNFHTFLIMGSAAVGALAFTFSDTFWFSAVEAEVYAVSSMITALIFWLILKWDSVSDKKGSEKWIVFIAFISGLSIGVHLLCLLVIPALTYLVYLKHRKLNFKNIAMASIYGIILLGLVQYGVILKTFKIGSYFELFFVNSLGLPFHTGLIFYFLLLLSLIGYGIYFTRRRGKKLANLALMSLLVLLMGYSTYAVILIRSSANPPMDENNPQNVFTLVDYLSREQYGSAPLFFGESFATPLDGKNPYLKGSKKYYQDMTNGKYVELDPNVKSVPNFDKKSSIFFPRMYSYEARHVKGYKQWVDFKGREVSTSDGGKVRVPTLVENIKFMISYQFGFMYWRYFMWNFAGRQNDIQGFGNKIHGNWLSGIEFIDSLRLGDQSAISPFYKDNKAYNTYFFLPFLLGLLGFIYHFRSNKKEWLTLLLFFFFTGLAIHLFINTPPFQPRERDYGYVGSFYVFAIWIGYGVFALYNFVVSKLKKSSVAIGVAVVLLSIVLVPGIMAKENWDDHDRSNCYTAADFSRNYLNSCDKNAILFTNGDNDTFPLWYLQEVERYRTDVRIVNLSLLNTDWYAQQIRRAAWEGEPVPKIITMDKIRGRRNEMMPLVEKSGVEGYIDIKQVINFVQDDSPASKITLRSTKTTDYIPTRKFSFKVNLKNCLDNNIIAIKDTSRVVDKLTWEVTNNYFYKKDLLAMDIIAANDWKRPVYFAITAGSESYLGLDKKYFSQEGLAYKLVPFETKSTDSQAGEVNSEKMYDNLMNKFLWGGVDKEEVYMNENNVRMCMNFRNTFNRLAFQFILEGKNDKAKKVLDRLIEIFPNKNVPLDIFLISTVEKYFKLGEFDKGDKLASAIIERYKEDLKYYYSLPLKYKKEIEDEIGRAKYSIEQLMLSASQPYKDKSKLPEMLKDDITEINQLLSVQ